MPLPTLRSLRALFLILSWYFFARFVLEIEWWSGGSHI
jgi:hypothetical protein